VVALGEVGYNVGAGMTGGVLYVPDQDDRLKEKINAAYVAIRDLNDEDLRTLKGMIQSHFNFTGSLRAQELLADFNGSAGRFRKISPPDPVFPAAAERNSSAPVTEHLRSSGEP
jgi:glutamate synthase domain-containing protein 3